MSKKLEYLQEVVEFQFNNDLSKGINHLELLTDSLFKLTQSLFDYKVKPAYHLRELEGKYFRFGLANQSIIQLIKGNRFRLLGNDVIIPDIFSFKSLTRMQIESYLIMHYLFFENVSEEEKDFRYDIYKVHALQKQMGFKINFDTQIARENRLKIQKELNQALENIKKNSIYCCASEKEKKEYLKPRFPKLTSSKNLFESSGLSKAGFNQMWQLYSNYAHAEHISDRQYNTTYNIKKSFTEDSSLILIINLILTSKLIVNITKLFDGAKIEFEKLSEKEKVIVDIWFNLKNKNVK
ncbi:hypothetical protein [uncultured Draconibacterium sp.]|uniref:hypothetical protein n=1 Tax=uncultured Draconibacterium sp. TaxID=1573823 RepID=UPI002AA6E927|nr:hypothetical protein [uncultured Draconibacterium sp.]